MITADKARQLVRKHEELKNTKEYQNIPEVLKQVEEDVQQAASLGEDCKDYLVYYPRYNTELNLVEKHLKEYGKKALAEELQKYGYSLEYFAGVYTVNWGEE